MLTKGLSGSQIKLIAVISMLIDHIGATIIEVGILRSGYLEPELRTLWINIYFATRTIGRMAFPIYCFLLVEGFQHTKNWKKYALRLGMFALISEIPFNLMIEQKLIYMESQNVFFTLFLGVILLGMMQKINNQVLQLFLVAGICALAIVLRTDYSYWGIILICIYYNLRNNRKLQVFAGYIWQQFSVNHILYKLGLVAGFACLMLYNGERGKNRFPLFFYWFYPIHMLVLYGILTIAF